MAVETAPSSFRGLDRISQDQSGFAPKPSQHRPAPNRRQTQGAETLVHAVGQARLHVINEKLFRGALVRERKTADRSNQPFGLLLVSYDAHPRTATSSTWVAAIEALAAVKRETDVLGWFEEQAMLGVILPEIGRSVTAVVQEIESRARQELASRLDAEAAGRFSIRLHVHPGRESGRADATESVDPLLVRLRSSHDDAATYNPIKRGLDIIASALLLAVLSPLFLLIAVLVRSPLPVLSSSDRCGSARRPSPSRCSSSARWRERGHAVHQDYITSFIKSSGQTQEAGSRVCSRLSTIRGSRLSDACFAKRALTSCPSSGTCSAARCRWSARGRRCHTRSNSTRPGIAAGCSRRSRGSRDYGKWKGAAARRSTRWCGWTSGTPGPARCGPTSRSCWRRPSGDHGEGRMLSGTCAAASSCDTEARSFPHSSRTNHVQGQRESASGRVRLYRP